MSWCGPTGDGTSARLLPFTVDGLILAASMVILDASRRGQHVPRLAAWSLGMAIAAPIGANLAHGLGHGPIGALISAWPALALIGSYELLMMLIRTGHEASRHSPGTTWHEAGLSQRAIARELTIDRRKVKHIIDRAEAA